MKSNLRTVTLLAVVILALLLLIATGGNYYAHLLALVFTNVILATSLRLSLMCGQLNIGHSAFMSVGAYTSALLAKNLGVPFELALLNGAALAMIVGAAMGYPSLRLRGVYFAMVTVAFVEAIRLIVQIWVPLTRGNAGLSVPKPSLLGMTLATRTSQYYLALVLMLIVLVILYKLERSRLGPVWKS